MLRETIRKCLRNMPPKRGHYLNTMVPRGSPRARDVLSYNKYLALSTEARLDIVRQAFVKNESFLRDSHVSGYYAAISASIFYTYTQCRGNSEIFAFRTYPFLCSHIFAPSERMYEQEIYTLLPPRRKIKFFSILTMIEYNIKASSLYIYAKHLGRKKYLKHYFIPALIEIYKGLEYLGRLYYVSIDNRQLGSRFKNFLSSFSSLQSTEINALWECRCGLVHSGCLYNRHYGKVWRFAVDSGLNDNLVISQDNQLSELEGQHFTIHIRGLISLFHEAKLFVYTDMMTNPQKYLTNKDFFLWIQRYLSLQYLPSQEELYRLVFAPNPPSNNSDFFFNAIPHAGIAKINISILYIFGLAFNRKMEDLFSRIRDFFSPL